jgi:hypothetical protein
MHIKTTNTFRGITAFIILVAFICSIGQLSAQKKKKKPKEDEESHQYDYTILRNTPDQVSKLTISLYPLVLPVNFSYGEHDGLFLAAGAGASYDINEKLTAVTNLSIAYLNADIGSGAPAVATPWYNFELGGAYYFNTEMKETEEHVYVYHSGNVSYYLKAPMDKYQKLGVRASFVLQNTPFRYNGGDFTGYGVNDPSQRQVSLQQHSFMTNVGMGIVALGFVSESVKDFDLKFVNDYGERKTSTKNQFYFDVLLAPVTTYSDANVVYSSTTSNDSTVLTNIDKFSKKSPLGARLGFTFSNLKPFGGSRTLEFGYMPNTGFYILAKIGMALNPKQE